MAIDRVARDMAMDAAAHSGGTAPMDSYTKSETDALLEQKADKSEVTESVTAAVAQIVADAPEDFDTLKEMSDWIASHEDSAAAMNTQILQNAADIEAVETQQTEQAAAISAAAEGGYLNRSTLGYQGKNLLKYNAIDAVVEGVSFTVNNGLVNATGSTTGDSIFRLFTTDTNPYIFDRDVILTYTGFLSGIHLSLRFGTPGSYSYVRVTSSEYRIPAGKQISQVYIQQQEIGVAVNVENFGVMIRYAEITDDTYEPYKPNVNERLNSVESVVSDVASDVAVNRSALGYQRKNLLKNTATTKTVNGVTYTVNADGSITANGTATANAQITVSDINLIIGKSYTLTGCPTGGSSETYRLYGLEKEGWTGAGSDTGGGVTFTAKKSPTTYRIVVLAGKTVTNLTFYPMLRYADITDDTYEPYKPSVQEQIEIIKEKKMDKTQIPDLMSLSMKMICPNNSVIPDDSGGVSAMVYIPAFKLKEVLTGYGNKGDELHPAFIVNGQAIPGFYYSKYQNHVNSGVAYSLPAEDPSANITFDTALARCTAKGAGWHLSTNAEWAAIALWCKKNGFMPYGNNNYGRDTRESNYYAIPTTKGTDGRTNHVATGTGPLSWSHDQTPSGIWDLNGNVSEWQGGIRTVWGELQILANNDAADPDNPQNATSTCWKAINATTGALVEPECSTTDTTGTTSGNTVRLDWVSNAWVFKNAITNVQTEYKSCTFVKVTAGSTIGEAAKVLLRALALLPDEGAEEADYEGDMAYWHNGAAERCVYRGGYFASVAGAGVFCVDGSSARSNSTVRVGFRSASISEIG